MDKKERYTEILAILPLYLEGRGDGSRILFTYGEKTVDTNAKKLLRSLFAEKLRDYDACMRRYGKLLGRKRNVPAVLSGDRVFVPVKVRKPIGKNDGAYGFVLLQSVEKIEGHRLVLFDGRQVPTLHTPEMLRRILARGDMATREALRERI